METEITDKKSGKKITLIVLPAILSIFLIYFAAMSMAGPEKKLKAIALEVAAKAFPDSTLDMRTYSDSTYLTLLKERAFLQSKTLMAETDSIYLTVNLSDSTARIEISGVVVHETKMSEISTSSILMKGDENIILSFLASPFTIANSYTTIRKEPVMIKMAPKDTSEYKPDIMPDTSITEPVNYILEMTDGTRIFIYQEETGEFSDRKEQFYFDMKFRIKDTWRSLKSVFLFKIPEYHPFIKMKLPRSDAKIIYRAIPIHAQVGIYK